MSTSPKPKAPWRIAVVTFLRQMDAQHGLDGIYRRAEQLPEVWIQRFDAEANDFRREVLTPLREWQPHGVIVRMCDPGRLRQLREQFPSQPFVSTLVALPGIANTVVVGDVMDAITKARDYFHHCGLPHMAMFCISTESLRVNTTLSFLEAVPAGHELVCPAEVVDAHTPAGKKRQREIMSNGLRKLPKPVGIMTRETEAAPFLLAWCHELGLRVPEEVQIIGKDEEDLCLACEPRLTSSVPPNRRIGEVALETMLHLLRKEQPPPPPIVRVSGETIVPRGSTALRGVGRRAVAVAIDRMQTHAARGLSASDVTRLSKVGRNTFYRQFNETTGNTPGQYLRKMRIENACRLLRETDNTVTAIGKECGFRSLESFANFFRRQTGETPTEYRKRKGRKKGAGR